jgi:hypothetical protein
MVSKCANPGCSNPFRYMHEGKLFRMEAEIQPAGSSSLPYRPNGKKSVRRMEFFWLCDNCASTMTLIYEKGVGVRVRPLAPEYRSSAA